MNIAVPKTYSLFWHIASESVWGNRGLVKTAHLWLPLSIIVSTNPNYHNIGVLFACLKVFVVVVCWSQACILANDLSDKHADRTAGKQRWIWRLPAKMGAFVVAFLVALGAFVIVGSGSSIGVLLAYAGSLVLGLFYSIRPLRFKEWGIWGLLAYSLSASLAFAVLPWAWFRPAWHLLVVLAPVVLLDKWVNLHFHEVLDYEADRSSGTRTYAFSVGLERARRSLRWVSRLASLSFLFVLFFLFTAEPSVGMPSIAIAFIVVLVVGIHAKMSQKDLRETSALYKELPWHYLGLSYALFRVVPLILFAQLALKYTSWLIIVGVAGCLILLESWYSLSYRYE